MDVHEEDPRVNITPHARMLSSMQAYMPVLLHSHVRCPRREVLGHHSRYEAHHGVVVSPVYLDPKGGAGRSAGPLGANCKLTKLMTTGLLHCLNPWKMHDGQRSIIAIKNETLKKKTITLGQVRQHTGEWFPPHLSTTLNRCPFI